MRAQVSQPPMLISSTRATVGGSSTCTVVRELPETAELPRAPLSSWPQQKALVRSVVIAHGTRYMPVWGYEFWVEEGADVVAEEEARIMIDRLVNFLQSIQYAMNPAEPLP